MYKLVKLALFLDNLLSAGFYAKWLWLENASGNVVSMHNLPLIN